MSGWAGQNFLFAQEQKKGAIGPTQPREQHGFCTVHYFVHVLSLRERIGFIPAGTRAHACLLHPPLSCNADWLAGWT